MRLFLLLVIAVVLSVGNALHRKIELNTDEPITATLVDVTAREVTAGEVEQLANKRAKERVQLQDDRNKVVADDNTQELEHIRIKDPQFALDIDLARRSFQEIQRHGYAQGYGLSGFTEQEVDQSTGEYYVEYVLHAKIDPRTGVMPKTGTGTRKKEGVEMPLSYEVQVLFDMENRFSVVAAWKLSEIEPRQGQRRARVMRLSIQPTAALLERKAKQAHSKPAVAIWFLAGGMGLIATGLLVMYNTRNPIPTPKPRRRSSDVWELVDENDHPIKTDISNKKND